MLPVIGVDQASCENCHRCISVCPVKYCIDGSGDTVRINHEICIGCGSCIDVCTHQARLILDDFEEFVSAVKERIPMVAVIAPSAEISFGKELLQFNGFLKSAGISAFFDVSFGAELTIESYLKHIQSQKPRTVISQPCPAIVSYIEQVRPELIPLLAPADSPMVHTIKMINRFYPKFKHHKKLVISPCIAKKREFAATGLGDYNVTFASMLDFIESKGIRLSNYEPVPFDEPVPERGVLFSSPGGLRETLRREAPVAASKTRKIEGRDQVYPYLDELAAENGLCELPAVIDCLNCFKGCNGGTGTRHRNAPLERMEKQVEKRAESQIHKHGKGTRKGKKKLRKLIEAHWEPGLYHRNYVNRKSGAMVIEPSSGERNEIYEMMLKREETHIYNCSACGYNSCKDMATAIFNGLNKPENCYHFQIAFINRVRERSSTSSAELHSKIAASLIKLENTGQTICDLMNSSYQQSAAIEESTASIIEMLSNLTAMGEMTKMQKSAVNQLIEDSKRGAATLNSTLSSIGRMIGEVEKINEMNETINSIARETNILAMNAAIEAAHSGEAGKGFAVVSDNIRNVAQSTGSHAEQIALELKKIMDEAEVTNDVSMETYNELESLLNRTGEMALGYQQLNISMDELTTGSHQIQTALNNIYSSSSRFHDFCEDLNLVFDDMRLTLNEIEVSSASNMKLLNSR